MGGKKPFQIYEMYVNTNYWWLNEKNPTKHGILIVPYKINHSESFFEKPTNLLQDALNYQDTCSKSKTHPNFV